jgi:hypothetical protein
MMDFVLFSFFVIENKIKSGENFASKLFETIDGRKNKILKQPRTIWQCELCVMLEEHQTTIWCHGGSNADCDAR